ncbi:hydrogenase maturation nickel metallochaperone HypA [Deinococcus yunweiensis]|uniref:hydrogenase maturation nickel metallochaperone HypA/HybF n=1 Tax=Deinococcus yunweiensis TaxID=367282 RepID=UPI00398EB552
MHEASIALSLIDVASEVLAEHGAARASALTVRIGQWSSVVPEALQAAFPACAQGTPLEGARLEVVTVPGVGECPQHGPVTLDVTRGLRCPVCDTPTPTLLQGDELELDALELAES